jgi:hypothetical protein
LYRRKYNKSIDICIFFDTFFKFFCIISDKEIMEGMTIPEIADKLGITYLAAKQRLLRAGIKPITKEAIYPNDAWEKIRNARPGRPPKAKPEGPDGAAKPKSAKK